MEEGTANDSLPGLKELEKKIGRKTPESLLIWMRDATLQDEGWSSDMVEGSDVQSIVSDSFSDQIRTLKLEMNSVRSTDVRILRQLVAVHEGIEAMRWLLEERGALASRGSSLTGSLAGSLSSLVALEAGPGLPITLCRDSSSPTSQQEPSDAAERPEPSELLTSSMSSTHSPGEPRSEWVDEGSLHHLRSRSELSWNTGEEPPEVWSSPNAAPTCSLVDVSQPDGGSHTSTTQDENTFSENRLHVADPLRRALVRSSRVARKGFSKGSRCMPARETSRRASVQAPGKSGVKEAGSMPTGEDLLLGYDAQWHWVESQDDVTFL